MSRRMKRAWWMRLAAGSILFAELAASAREQENFADAYETYVKTSRDFQRVRQPQTWAESHFPAWVVMPWAYQWTIGYDEAAARWAKEHGYNGGFLDGGVDGLDAGSRARKGWLDRHGLPFYLDHAAAKRRLHLWDGNEVKPHLDELHGTGVRPVPLDAALASALRAVIRRNVDAVKDSPVRAAYALDDEASWGHFVHPTMWRVNDDRAAYDAWLRSVYGPNPPRRDGWVGYEAIRPKLADWTLAEFDASPLLDQWTYNDSVWLNLVGDLVTYSNELDPRTPCGIVGGQAPSPFGGYDYAKLMRKVQFIESYNLGSAPSLIRSFNPGNALPSVTTLFHRSSDDDIWQTWAALAHGNRGFIAWVEGWFDGTKPKPWHGEVGPTFREAATKIGPLLAGAESVHDGVALYYSHASIQLGWVLDAAAHGKTWVNRNNDARLGSSPQVRHAWENLLRDGGIQPTYISYADVIERGVPADIKVLILPETYCLSDAEARRIEAFCRAGGTVIADALPGLWDQHGKGRAYGGALDALFGVRHDPALKAKDLFNGDGLWCEVNQDRHYNWKTYAAMLTEGNTCLEGPEGYHRAVRAMPNPAPRRVGSGTAVLLNQTPQRYNAYREAGHAASLRRSTFLDPVLARVAPWVGLRGAGDAEHGHEITAWRKAGRTVVCLVQNPEVTGSETGGGNAAGLKTGTVPVVLRFAGDVADARDERTGRPLGSGREFPLSWTRNEAVVVSFAGDPPRPARP